MSKALRNRARKFGMSPGSLVPLGKVADGGLNFRVFDYDRTTLAEKDHASVEECLECIKNDSTTWINIQGIHDPKVLEALGKRFDLHPLMLEDILNAGQRSKLDDYKTAIFVVMRVFYYNESTKNIDDEQVSLVLGSHYVISFSEGGRDVFDPIRERLKVANSRMRSSGADYLCYALIDCIVDHHFIVLEKIEELVDSIDDEVFNRPDVNTMHKIQMLKRNVITLRKGVWPIREVVSQMRRIDSPLIAEQTKLFLHDVYDHTIQAVDSIESFRDIVSGMLEVYLSNISNRMNEVMKLLTIVSTIFVPLTFIAGIYGMNFDHMPELHASYSYFVVLGVMLCIFFGMLNFFRRKQWI